MTAATTATGPAPGGAAAARGFARRNRTSLLLGAGVLATLLLISWLTLAQAGQGGSLDPANPAPEGARAVARVLADRGVEVDIARGRAEFESQRLNGATIVVSNPTSLGASTWRDLDRRAADANAILVVLGISPAVADGVGLGGPALAPPATAGAHPGACSPANPLFDELSLRTDPLGTAADADGCFGEPGHRELVVDRGGDRWVLLDPTPVANEQIDEDENAAVILRLLGQRDRVVWYVADSADTVISDGVGLSGLLPDWLAPGLWMLAAAAVAFLLWRGRRLGPLVTEPLPVAVKALESTTALGRLYERARDREHAASLLVAGTVGRLAAGFGLGPGAGRDAVAQVLAARTGWTPDHIRARLPAGPDLTKRARRDTDLVALAHDLRKLEDEVLNP